MEGSGWIWILWLRLATGFLRHGIRNQLQLQPQLSLEVLYTTQEVFSPHNAPACTWVRPNIRTSREVKQRVCVYLDLEQITCLKRTRRAVPKNIAVCPEAVLLPSVFCVPLQVGLMSAPAGKRDPKSPTSSTPTGSHLILRPNQVQKNQPKTSYLQRSRPQLPNLRTLITSITCLRKLAVGVEGQSCQGWLARGSLGTKGFRMDAHSARHILQFQFQAL